MCTKVFQVKSTQLYRTRKNSLTLLPKNLIYLVISGGAGTALNNSSDLVDIYNNDGGTDIFGDIWTLVKDE